MKYMDKTLDHVCARATCTWRGPLNKARKADHPFQPGQTISGCPECGTIGVFVGCQTNDCTWPGTLRGRAFCKGPFYCHSCWDMLGADGQASALDAAERQLRKDVESDGSTPKRQETN